MTNFGEHLLRRVDRRAFLRPAGPAARAAGQARAGHRPEPGLRAEHRAAAAHIKAAMADGDGGRRTSTSAQVVTFRGVRETATASRTHPSINCGLPLRRDTSWTSHSPNSAKASTRRKLVRWLVKPGDAVKPGQSLLEVMTDKATMEVPAPFAGTIKACGSSRGRRSRSAQAILELRRRKTGRHAKPAPPQGRAASRRPPPRRSPARDNGPTAPRAGQGGAVGAPDGPQARHRPGHVHGSGPDGRILIDDLRHRTSGRTAEACRRRRPARLRQARHAHQAARPAPQDRRAHGPREAHHPALHLRR